MGIDLRLKEHAAGLDWGKCGLYFARADEFFGNPEESRFTKIIKNTSRDESGSGAPLDAGEFLMYI